MSPIPGGPGHVEKKKKAVSHPAHQHKGTTAQSDPHPVGQHGNDSGTGTVTSTHSNPPAWIIRRQQVLRRAGFNIAVDGVWGSASQSAWEAFTQRLTPSQAAASAAIAKAKASIPAGMVRLQDGRVVPASVAHQYQLVKNAQRTAAQALRQQTPAQVAEIQRIAQRTGHPGPANLAGKPGAGPLTPKQARRRAIAQQKAEVHDALLHIAGPEGLKALAAPGVLASRAADGLINAHDLALLMRHGYIDPTNHDDVRVIQQVIDHHLPSQQRVHVSGQYDIATDAALKTLFANTAARDFKAQVEHTRKQLFVTGIAQAATQRVLGRTITDPASLLRILQRGGPDAVRLARALSRGYEQHQEDVVLQHIKDVRAKALGGISALDKAFGSPYSNDFLLATSSDPVDKLLLQSGNLRQFRTLTDAYLRHAELKQLRESLAAKHDPSWWQEGISSVSSVLSYGVGKTEGAYAALQYWGEGVNNATAKWVQDHTGLDTSWGVTGIDKNGQPVPKLFAGTGALGEWRDVRSPDGYVSWHRAWMEGQITLSELPWYNRLALDIVLDPLNLVGVGLGGKVVRGGFSLAARGSLRAEDILDKVAPILRPEIDRALREANLHAYETFAHVSQSGIVVPVRGWMGAKILGEETRRARYWGIASSTRAAAIGRVNDAIRQSYVTTLRDITIGRIAGSVESKISALGRFSDDIARLVDPQIMGDLNSATAAARSLLPEITPALHEAILSIPTSLYARYGRDGAELSLAGRRIHGFFQEYASRAILTRYVILRRLDTNPLDLGTLSKLSVEQLRTIAKQQLGDAEYRKLLDEAGSWYAGHPPLDLREAYFNELRVFTDRLERQLLPALDELMRLRHGDGIWAMLGDIPAGLLAEGGAAVRDALDQFFGYSVEQAFDPANYVRVKNTNFGVIVSDADHLILETDEIERGVRSYDGWIEMQQRIDGTAISADTIEKAHLAIRAKVEARWTQLPDGRWKDTERWLRVPAPLARSMEPTYRTAAHREGALLSDLLTGFDRTPTITTSADAGRVVAATQNEIDRILGNDPWTKFADQSGRIEALQAMAEGQIATGLYLKNGLILDYLKSHQAWYARRTYNVLTLGLAGWKTATLPFRPAFYVRNVVDNYTKAFLSGLRDPRAFFNPEGKSIFEMTAYRALHGASRYYDTIFGTDVAGFLDHLENLFWQQPDSTISKLFGVHDIEVPPSLYSHKRTIAALGDEELIKTAPDIGHITGGAIRRASTKTKDWKDRWTSTMWDLMAARPENLAKRQLYIAKYRSLISAGHTSDEASRLALETVEFTLFDYEKVTVLDEQLKVLAPFIFFWRKNATFWATTAARQPWFFLTADKLYSGHEQTNSDMPDWMRRYVNLAPVAPITDALGLTWASNWLRDGTNFDPLNYVSFVQFYKAFKSASAGDNPLLPPDKQGSWGFISALVDGLNSVGGLGINPFLSEAGQRLGILNRWAWRDIYPQTTLLQAITSTDWLREHLGAGPTGFNVEDALLDPIFKQIGSEPSGNQLGLDRFNFYVQQEMAGQVLRGEPADRAKAEAKIRGFIAFQTLMGFGIGIFPRRISSEDLALYQLINLRHQLTVEGNDSQLLADWYNLSPAEQEAYRLFKARGYDPAAFDRYRRGLDAARTFFQIEDPQDQQQYLQDHPEALPIINPISGGRVPSDEYLKTQILLARQDAVFKFGETYLKGIDASPDVKAAAYDTLVTPSLRAFWAQNDTAYDQQQRQIRGSYFKYIGGIQETYFNIPDTNYAAKQDYLQRHPELQDWWAQNDGATDDYRNLMQYVNGTFRTLYFHFVDQGDWNSADEFLRRHPFIFDFTSAEGRVDPNGHWIPKSEQQRDYAKAAPDLRVYYSLAENLRDDYARAHPIINWFLTKYGAAGTPMKPGYTSYLPGGLTQHGKDYLAVAKQLTAYFNLSTTAQKAAFLESHPEVKAYFAKYAQQTAASQHARDYLAVKPVLDQYFSLPESERGAFISRHPELSAYFSKYSSGRNGHSGASYEEATRRALAEHPDIAQRYQFWMQLFALPPNQRAEFVHRRAADAGIFIYGSLSYDARQLQEKRWHRQALALGESDRAFLYDRVAPLLQIYFSLPAGGGERTLFLQTNPDLQLYLDKYAKGGATGNAHLDKLLEAYFLIPGFDPRRNQFLLDHPELKVYFNRDASPKEKALQAAVDVYFKLPYGPIRERYLAEHPEIRNYFDQRQHEHDLFSSLAAAFNDSDPRMAEFKAMYADIVPLDAIHLWMIEQKSKHEIVQTPSRDATGRRKPKTGDALQTRRDRAGASPPATI